MEIRVPDGVGPGSEIVLLKAQQPCASVGMSAVDCCSNALAKMVLTRMLVAGRGKGVEVAAEGAEDLSEATTRKLCTR